MDESGQTTPETGPRTGAVAVAGAAGDLGGRIVRALLDRGATVRMLVDAGADPARTAESVRLGATTVPVTWAEPASVTAALDGVDAVVSAWNGLRDVIVDRQSVLVDAAVEAGVRRFVPSDYCLDWTRTHRGDNRNIDLRREFAGRADRASIATTSVLVGAFTDLLTGPMPVLQPRLRRVLYWVDADQPLDFTTRDDTAAVTAEVALHPGDQPRFVRFVGDSVTARDLARISGEIAGVPYRLSSAGGVRTLSAMIVAAQRVDRASDAVFPAWQGMQYLRDMFTGRGTLQHRDNAEFPIEPTDVATFLRSWEKAGDRDDDAGG
ncbi:NmrA family NAD(P)-binding protein [Tersicoccus sp. MR15.9]|uniref:NmrA family NAD(P)-binding protein n=1 Tax=Tersicoccus mangrovi TaxID=3121635 RepID=UPI002FE50C26